MSAGLHSLLEALEDNLFLGLCCWLNSVPCSCRTKASVFLLGFNQGHSEFLKAACILWLVTLFIIKPSNTGGSSSHISNLSDFPFCLISPTWLFCLSLLLLRAHIITLVYESSLYILYLIIRIPVVFALWILFLLFMLSLAQNALCLGRIYGFWL